MSLDLGPVGRARIWLDEVAESRGERGVAVEDEVTSDTRGWFLLDEVSIELFWSRGERSGYGLLGCTFARSNTGGTRLRAHTCPAGNGPVFDEHLSGDGDVVRWGLPADYGRSVLEGAKEGLRARGSVPAGQLAFTVAACSETGSDAALFQRLGHLCVRLLDLSIETDENGAARVVREIIEGSPAPEASATRRNEMKRRLEGKTAIVTGASSGIGRATAQALAREGVRVVLAGRTQKLLDDAVAAIRAEGVEAFAVAGDVRRESDVAALFQAAASRLGKLDILVNSAGVGYPGPAVEGRPEQWREMLETNVLALCLACREGARAMAGRGGTLVNVSALAGSEPAPGFAAYAASKHAVNGFSDSLRLELAGSGIRVLVVEPGQTMTSFARNIPHAQLVQLGRTFGLPAEAIPNFEGKHAPPQFIEAASRALPDRFLSADKVASAIVSALVAPDPGVMKITLRPG